MLTASRKSLSTHANSLKVEENPSISVRSLELEVLANSERPTGSKEKQPAAAQRCQLQPGQRLSVRWRRTEAVSGGAQVVVILQLRRPWGASNPHSFNFERWLVASGYSETGYARTGPVREGQSEMPLRARWVSKVDGLLAAKGLVHHGTLMALVTGDGGAVLAQTWERYRRTGAIDLLVVSGLHVSVLALLLYGLISYPVRLVTVVHHRMFAPLIGAGLVCLCAMVLAWFTGLGSPVMRVALMLLELWLLQLLLAPHHGSKTSSSIPFVRHVSPRFVVYSAGRSNRYGRPHRHVVRRFVWGRSQQFITAESGAIRWCSHRPGRVVTKRP